MKYLYARKATSGFLFLHYWKCFYMGYPLFGLRKDSSFLRSGMNHGKVKYKPPFVIFNISQLFTFSNRKQEKCFTKIRNIDEDILISSSG